MILHLGWIYILHDWKESKYIVGDISKFCLKSVFNEENRIDKIHILSTDQYFRKPPWSLEITDYAKYSIYKYRSVIVCSCRHYT